MSGGFEPFGPPRDTHSLRWIGFFCAIGVLPRWLLFALKICLVSESPSMNTKACICFVGLDARRRTVRRVLWLGAMWTWAIDFSRKMFMESCCDFEKIPLSSMTLHLMIGFRTLLLFFGKLRWRFQKIRNLVESGCVWLICTYQPPCWPPLLLIGFFLVTLESFNFVKWVGSRAVPLLWKMPYSSRSNINCLLQVAVNLSFLISGLGAHLSLLTDFVTQLFLFGEFPNHSFDSPLNSFPIRDFWPSYVELNLGSQLIIVLNNLCSDFPRTNRFIWHFIFGDNCARREKEQRLLLSLLVGAFGSIGQNPIYRLQNGFSVPSWSGL